MLQFYSSNYQLMFLSGVAGRGGCPVALARCTVPCDEVGFWAITLLQYAQQL